MQTHKVDVLIAGLGPVGSVAALYLARHGITVAALESNPGATDLRASTFHPPTLEMLDSIGAADTLKGRGLKAPEFQYRDRASGETIAFDMSELASDTAFPFRIQCEQHYMSQEVIEKLGREAKAKVSLSSRLTFFEQHDDKVVAYAETPYDVERYEARYLIGADGANSLTRKLLGLGFGGFTYKEKFLCLSTEYPVEDAFENLCFVNYISDPDEWMVLLRVPTLWRILVPAENSDADDYLLSDEKKNDVFARMLKRDVDVKTYHRTIYRVHQRVADAFEKGRVCLIGDAAHLNSPMGGFGMNSGIHDAFNLCERLVRILRDKDDTRLIAQFGRQRRQVTHDFVQAQTIENTKAMSQGWGSARENRRRQMEAIQSDPAARRAYLRRQAMFTSLEDAAAIQ
jgi:3-(3-hydroxy-phenyl)propionate hydroxylase